MLHVPETEIRRPLRLAARTGEVDQVAHDHFFLRSAIGEIVAIADEVAAASPERSFSAADLRDRLHNGRKVAIQILEFLDRHGVTLRRGDFRRINPHRRDLFEATNSKDRPAPSCRHVPSSVPAAAAPIQPHPPRQIV